MRSKWPPRAEAGLDSCHPCWGPPPAGFRQATLLRTEGAPQLSPWERPQRVAASSCLVPVTDSKLLLRLQGRLSAPRETVPCPKGSPGASSPDPPSQPGPRPLDAACWAGPGAVLALLSWRSQSGNPSWAVGLQSAVVLVPRGMATAGASQALPHDLAQAQLGRPSSFSTHNPHKQLLATGSPSPSHHRTRVFWANASRLGGQAEDLHGNPSARPRPRSGPPASQDQPG